MTRSTVAINAQIGRKIGALLSLKGKDNTWLAEKIGVTQTRIGRIVKGSSAATAAELIQIADALEVTADNLSEATI